MSKFLKNVKSPVGDIFITDLGMRIPPGTYEVIEQEYLMWAASDDIVTEIISGDIVVNDGINDLSNVGGATSDAVNFIKYPDFATNQRFLSEPERSNSMAKKTTQEAIEEARPDIYKDGVSVLDDVDIVDFEGDNVEVTADVPNRRAIVKISDDTSDTLYWVSCLDMPNCEPEFTDISFLMDHKLCYIKQEDC